MHALDQAPLGKKSSYTSTYSPELLFVIPRAEQRASLTSVAFYGKDIWNAYELSWLNPKGKPQVAIGEFIIPCESAYLIESKSFKLYLNSLNQTRFDSLQAVTETIAKDVCRAVKAPVQISLLPLQPAKLEAFHGTCLDRLDVSIDCYERTPELLKILPETAQETVYTDLFKSNCLVTGQPDWASVCINYSGKKIHHESLLQYLVSFRNHHGFHEHCTEQIFADIMEYCKPDFLTVYARFLRRGGLDINSIRSSKEVDYLPLRLIRQ